MLIVAVVISNSILIGVLVVGLLIRKRRAPKVAAAAQVGITADGVGFSNAAFARTSSATHFDPKFIKNPVYEETEAQRADLASNATYAGLDDSQTKPSGNKRINSSHEPEDPVYSALDTVQPGQENYNYISPDSLVADQVSFYSVLSHADPEADAGYISVKPQGEEARYDKIVSGRDITATYE